VDLLPKTAAVMPAKIPMVAATILEVPATIPVMLPVPDEQGQLPFHPLHAAVPDRRGRFKTRNRRQAQTRRRHTKQQHERENGSGRKHLSISAREASGFTRRSSFLKYLTLLMDNSFAELQEFRGDWRAGVSTP
jgi:hypothetical protein